MTAYQYIFLFTIIFLSSTTAFQSRQCSGGDCPVIFPDPSIPPICYWAVDVVLDPSLSSTSSPLSLVQTTYNDSTMSISTQVHAESQLNVHSLPYESDLQVNISAPTCSIIEIDVSAKEKDSTISSYRSIGNLTWIGLAELLPSTEAGILCESDSDDCQIDLDTSVLNGSPIKIESNSIVRSGKTFYVAYNHTLFKQCGGWILISNMKLTCTPSSSSTVSFPSSSSSSSTPKAFCRFIFGKKCSKTSTPSSSEHASPSHSQSDSSSSSESTAADSYELPPLPETTVLPQTTASSSAPPEALAFSSSPTESAVAAQPSNARSSIPVGGIFTGAPLQHVNPASSSSSSPSSATIAAPILVASSSSVKSSWIAQW